jgi:transposase
MTRFPAPAHFASWAKFTPRHQHLRRRGQRQRLDRAREPLPRPHQAVVCAGRTNTFLGARYRRITRGGKKKAIVAVGRSMLVIIWHLLADPDSRFHELGADHYDRHVNTHAKRRNHVRELEALGYRVTLEPRGLKDTPNGQAQRQAIFGLVISRRRPDLRSCRWARARSPRRLDQ